ncbi:hypothetical protein QQS21_009514 [Conoideocrella luteorostrata]|uniref:Xylanolytic transcriptional activator regulatory domain-containing protein n=1 Tax=Conoideocrella luteorostrata TaxID=1105319 RepID=A0AAJ0CGU9_9HYPO|nr:hypothetical protein QQS21_009514 [Conoideocrella luteorostrata]
MEVMWELSNTSGVPRKRAAKACGDCKRRKKKCSHTRWTSRRRRTSSQQPPGDSEIPQIQQLSHETHRSQFPSDGNFYHGANDAKSSGESTDPSNEPIPVGDYHVESILTELVSESPEDTSSRAATQDAGEPFKSSITQLVGRRNNMSRCCSKTIERFATRWAFDISLKPKTWVLEHYHSHMQPRAPKPMALPKETQDALITTYISNLDALVPIFDGSLFLREYVQGSASPHMVKAICLTACKIKQAAPYLRLTDNGPVLTQSDFASLIYKDLEVAVDLDLEPSRLVKIQTLALMWLHHDSHRGIHKASTYLVQAIRDAFILALNFEDADRPNREQCRSLWWTLRAFDRQNTCLQGHPFIIMDRDVDISGPEPRENSRSQAAFISLRLGNLMDEVMEIYRPRLQRRGVTVLEEFPTFAQVLEGTDLQLLQESNKDYLEIWYLVLAMLSCRHSTPHTRPYERRFRSAERVQQLTANGRHSSLPPLPMVPYAVALSLTVTLRAAKDRPQAAEELTPMVASLQITLIELGKWSVQAAGMSRLAQKLMGKLLVPSATSIKSNSLSSNTAEGDSIFGSDRTSSQSHGDLGTSGELGSKAPFVLHSSVHDTTWEIPASRMSSGHSLEATLPNELQPAGPDYAIEDLSFGVFMGFEEGMNSFQALTAPGLFDFSSDNFL